MQEGHFPANAFSCWLSELIPSYISAFLFSVLFQSDAGYGLHPLSWLEYEKEVKLGIVDTWTVSHSVSCCFGILLKQERGRKQVSVASSLGEALLQKAS